MKSFIYLKESIEESYKVYAVKAPDKMDALSVIYENTHIVPKLIELIEVQENSLKFQNHLIRLEYEGS